jgi:hypothetical protein
LTLFATTVPTPEDTPTPIIVSTPTIVPTPTAITLTPVPQVATRTPAAPKPTYTPKPTVVPTARPLPGLEIFDINGNPQDMGWVRYWYGSDIERANVPPGTPVFRVVQFQEREGQAVITVWVLDENNQPIAGADVVVISPGGRQDSDKTKDNGEWAFPMGPGSYLACYGFEGCSGPHDVIISYQGIPSDKARRLGMLGGTFHRHLNVIFRLYRPEGDF